MGNFASNSNMTSIMTAIGNKIKALNGAYIFKGSIAFASLPASPTSANVGEVYNINEEFTTTSAFVEGAGKKYPAGTNVAIADIGTAGSPSIKFDVQGSFYDVDSLATAISAIAASVADEFDDTQAYSTGDVVVYENALYVFTADHAAGDWDSSEVNAVTLEDLINAAEPDELTSTQVSDLIDLLS